jgi:CRISPR-associated endonuclease/helicase Cas3
VNTPDGEVDLCDKTAPYTSKSQVEQFVSTLEQVRLRSGSRLEFTDEQDIVSAVHGAHDRQIIQQLQMGAYDHRRLMFAVMRGDDSADARNLIREVSQQQVTIHADPDVLKEAPFDAPSFGIYPGTLQNYIEAWLERYDNAEDDSIPCAVMYLYQFDLKEKGGVVQFEDAAQANEERYKWIEVRNDAKEVRGAPLIVVHPALATYDSKLGFLPNQGGTWQVELPKREQRSEEHQYGYRLETYEDHIAQVYKAFTELWREMDYAARRLESQFGWERGSVRHAAELAVLLHDVGKLSVKWQGWVQKYQASIGEPVDDNQVYAHTELQTAEHREAERKMGKRPWHAVEGAIAVTPILVDNLGEDHPLVYAVYSAIARHHAPYSDTNQIFKLVRGSERFVQLAAKLQHRPTNLIGLNELISPDFGAKDAIAQPGDSEARAAYLSYLLFVRVLRRADQLGTARGVKGL